MDLACKEDLLAFELKIRRREIYNTHLIAEQTIKMIQRSFRDCKTNADTEHTIRTVTDHIVNNFPNDVIFRNICDQVILKLDEELTLIQPKRTKKAIPRSQSKKTFLEFMVPDKEESDEDFEADENDLKYSMTEVLDNFSDELSRSYQGIAKDALDYLHTNDIILTLGLSKSVDNFLTSSNVKVTVIIPERAPENDGFVMANILRAKGIPVIVIPDSAIYAIIPKVNTVILPARSVLANGGITAYSLAHTIALAAKRYSKPVIVLYWEMKLTSEMYHPGESYSTLRQPGQVISKEYPTQKNTIAINPEGDYVPPELITLMINENKPHCPGDVFSLVQANYYGDDH